MEAKLEQHFDSSILVRDAGVGALERRSELAACALVTAVSAEDCRVGPWAATLALRNVVMGWIGRGMATALVFAALGTLLGFLSRRYLPTRSIFELM